MKDNFDKICGIIILLLIALSTLFTIRASAEEYTVPETAVEVSEDSAQADLPETGETIQVTGVQTYDPQLYERLDKMQESIDALTAALTPSEDAQSANDELPAQSAAPDYTAQLSAISEQLVDLRTVATAETAEPAAFDKPFEDYSVTEVLLLVLAAVAVGAIVIGFVRRL